MGGCWVGGGAETADGDAGQEKHWHFRGRDGKFCSLNRLPNREVVLGVSCEERGMLCVYDTQHLDLSAGFSPSMEKFTFVAVLQGACASFVPFCLTLCFPVSPECKVG